MNSLFEVNVILRGEKYLVKIVTEDEIDAIKELRSEYPSIEIISDVVPLGYILFEQFEDTIIKEEISE